MSFWKTRLMTRIFPWKPNWLSLWQCTDHIFSFYFCEGHDDLLILPSVVCCILKVFFLSSDFLRLWRGGWKPSLRAQKSGYLETDVVGVHLPGSCRVSSFLVHPAALQKHGNDYCHGRADASAKTHGYIYSVYSMMGSYSMPLGTSITLALLSHNNNKTTHFMRTRLSALEKAATIGKGTQFFGWKSPNELQRRFLRPGARSSGDITWHSHAVVDQVALAYISWRLGSWYIRIKQALSMMNLLLFTAAVATRQPREVFQGTLQAKSEGMGRSAFLHQTLGSAGSVDPEVSLIPQEAGWKPTLWLLPELNLNPWRLKRVLWGQSDGFEREWGKTKTHKKKGKRKNREKQIQSFDMAKMEKTRLVCGQQFRAQPGGEPKAECACSQMEDVLLLSVRSLHQPPLADWEENFLEHVNSSGKQMFCSYVFVKVLVANRDPQAPARWLILKTRLQRSRSNMASCAGQQQALFCFCSEGLSEIRIIGKHLQGKFYAFAMKKKRNIISRIKWTLGF